MDSQNEKNLNNIEKKTPNELLCDLIIDTIEESFDNTPPGKDKKEYLLKTLNRIYSPSLVAKIMVALPDDFFVDEEKIEAKKEPEVIKIKEPTPDMPSAPLTKETEIETPEIKIETETPKVIIEPTKTAEEMRDLRAREISAEVEEIKRKKREKLLQEQRDRETAKEKKAREKLERKEAKRLAREEKKKQKEENKINKNTNKEKPKKIKKEINWKKYFNMGKYFVPAVVVAGMTLAKPFEKKETTNNKKEKTENTTNERRVMGPEEMIELPNPRFNKEVFDSIPEQMKSIYKRHAENNPTPGRGYEVLDKINALLYVFDYDNNLVVKTVAGFGTDAGDAPNTSGEYKKGVKTTPAGVYVISNYATPEDLKEYGELQFSLYGISLQNDTIFLGVHQTYSGHGELKRRTKKLETPSALDNLFSDGCVNIKPEIFKEDVKPYFRGDWSELFYVLQDEASIKSGAKFDVDLLIKKVMPIIINAADKEKEEYSKRITEKLSKIKKLQADTTKLQKNQKKLNQKYKKNTKIVKKQKEIEKIQEEINGTYKMIEDVEEKRKNAEKILAMKN